MLTYKTKQIADCIIDFIEKNNIKPALVSLTLAFGSYKDEEETPELIVGVLTYDEYKNYIGDEDFLECILNQAEYEYQEIAYECLEHSVKIVKSLSREEYVTELMNVKRMIAQQVTCNLDYNIFFYAHDLDDFDYEKIFHLNFTKEEQEKIMSNN